MSGVLRPLDLNPDISRIVSERRAIIKWLSPPNLFPAQDDFFGVREEGTGEWFLDSSAFRIWRDGSGGTLWCPGIRTIHRKPPVARC